MTVSDYRRLFQYEIWANNEYLEILPDLDGRPRKLFGHIMASQQLWLDRLTSSPQSMSVWPSLTIDDLRTLHASLESAWNAYFDALTDDMLTTTYAYVNTEGQRWESTIADTLTHLITHACYHRGQIAQTLAEAGKKPPYTDFIHATRQHLV